MFSSCLENIEPEGIADLRGAKAELLRAETALVEAKAARENAEAAIALAKAKVEEAIAKQEEAKAAYEAAVARLWELEAEKKEAMNAIELEQAMAEAKAAIALAEKQAAVYAAELERALMLIQADVVKAQIEYEKALKNLAVAKVALTKKQEDYLKPFVLALTTAENNVDEATVAFEEASEALADALEMIEMNKEYFVRWGERGVAKAEAALEGALEAVEIAEAALKIDATVVDWVAMRAELEAEKKAIEDKGMASYVDGEYAELKATLYGVYAEVEEGEEPALVEEGLIHKAEEYTGYTGMTFDEETGKFVEPVFPVVPSSNTAMEYPAVYVAAPVNAEGDPVYDDFRLEGYTTPEEDDPSTYVDDDAPKLYYGDASEVVDYFDQAIADAEMTADPSTYEAVIAGANKRMKDTQNSDYYKNAYEEYEKVLKVYTDKTVAAYYEENALVIEWEGFRPVRNPWDGTAAAADYNAALDAAKKAVADYNKAFAEAEVEEPDFTEIQKARTDAEAAADAKKFAEYQKAQAAYRAAYVTYDAARIAYGRAVDAHGVVIDAAQEAISKTSWEFYTSTGDLEADLKKACEDYAAYVKAAKEADEEFEEAEADVKANAVYSAQYAAVSQANKDFNGTGNDKSAEAVWTKAKEAFEKAKVDNTDALTKADETWTKEYADALKAYDDAYDKLIAGTDSDKEGYVGNVNVEYLAYLESLATDAGDVLRTAISKVTNHAQRTSEYVLPNSIGDNDTDAFTIWFDGDEGETVPSFLVDENGDLKDIKVEDLVDIEYFKNVVVKEAADNIAAMYHVSGIYWYNAETLYSGSDVYLVPGAPADYPLSLPTYESFTAAMEEYDNESAYINDELRKLQNECLKSGGNYEEYDPQAYYNYPVNYDVYSELDDIADAEEGIANVAAIADFAKAIEAAKAEFEAYVAEAEKEVDAIRTEVEAAWAEVYPKYAELEEARETAMARYAEVGKTITRITNAINLYVFNNYPVDDEYIAPVADDESTTPAPAPEPKTIEELVEALQAVYDRAVETAELAELKVEYAKKRLQDIKDDKVSFVEEAQKDFDEAEAELEEAMAELAEAAAALEAAMKAVGADQVPVAPGSPETPETPETPAE